MKTLYFFVAALFFSLLSTFAFAQAIPKNGSYKYGGKDGGGVIEVKNATATGFDFFLNVSQGMHSGTIEDGKAKKKGKIYIYKAPVEEIEFENCKLSFDFKGSLLTVIQEGSDVDCGFGMGIYAGGNYKLK